MHKLLTRLFGKPEEINGGERCPTYLYRWFILRTRWWKCYLHHITREWGFWNAGRWIYWRDYVSGDSKHLADAARTCGDGESFQPPSEVPHA